MSLKETSWPPISQYEASLSLDGNHKMRPLMVAFLLLKRMVCFFSWFIYSLQQFKKNSLIEHQTSNKSQEYKNFSSAMDKQDFQLR